MHIQETDKPIPEDFILKELSRLQDMVLCADIPKKSRYILSSVIDAAFIFIEQVRPGYHRPKPYTLRNNLMN